MKKNNVIVFLIAALLFFAAGPSFADACFSFTDISGEGQLFNEHYVDLDGDGVPEKIALSSYNLQYYEKEIQGYFGQLVVFKSVKNKYVAVWQSPKLSYKQGSKMPSNKYRFYFGDVGMEPLEVVGDIFGDGKIEILSPAMQSDVRPAQYRMYVWDGKKFEYAKEGYLLADSIKIGKFEWKNDYIFKDGAFLNPWISYFSELTKPGYLVGNIVSYTGSSTSFFGQAYIKGEKDFFKVINILNIETEK